MAGTTALLRSAASIRDQLATYQDSVQAYQYGNSAYTDSALSSYASYLNSRISALNKSGSISDASKALSLTKALDSATKSNISATITRENIQMLSGNASLTDKYNVVAQQFVRAQANGDMTLAQSLMNQAYSISQSIQLQQQQAADAAASYTRTQATLAKSNATKLARSDGDVAKTIESAIKQFNDDYAHAGRKSSDKVISDFVKSMEPTFASLGIHLQKGQQPNYFDIVDGANRAAFTAYTNAGLAVSATADDGGQSYYDKATALVGKISTIYGTMNANQLASAAANPNQFSYKQDPDFVAPGTNKGIGGKQNPQTGYTYDTKQGVVPSFASSPWIQIPAQTNNRLQALNLHVVAKSDNTFEVAATAQSPTWLKNALPSNSTAHIIANTDGSNAADGQLTFEADALHGNGKAIYTIAKDNSVYESSVFGDREIFNPHQQPLAGGGKSFWQRLGGGIMSGLKGIGNDIMGHASADEILQNATGHYQLPPIPVAQPVSLPPLHLAPAPAPAAPLHVASAPRVPSVRPPTYNPQPVSTAPIQGSKVSPQQSSGGSSLNTSGGGWSYQF